jgi:hypothetical protein
VGLEEELESVFSEAHPKNNKIELMKNVMSFQ